MSDYVIRLYNDSDYDAVRDLFARGIRDHPRVAFNQALRHPQICIFLLVVFCFPLVAFESILLSVLGLAPALVAIWICTSIGFQAYAKVSLLGDLKDIHKYYIQEDNNCFWVAESAGQVVGIVGVRPSDTSPEKCLELKRMSVAKEHRGKGIAKALCRTAINFGRDKRYKSIVLVTTTAHIAGQRLYESIGFSCTHRTPAPILWRRLAGVRLLHYKYDISAEE
ncbi:putative N-acetyltransferase 8B [Bombina bombina]|uniref:putative N-acetyltransferase 8B n=1 Tax=Bombina bombina TaxID=8345 RepID=UPI00235AB66B|nr:putative N-acetyltransferase 8B [Bombina bombina]